MNKKLGKIVKDYYKCSLILVKEFFFVLLNVLNLLKKVGIGFKKVV